MEDLLDVVRLGGDVHALPQLERGLAHGRDIAARADDGDAVVAGDRERLLGEHALDRGREPDVLAAQRGERATAAV